jgi:hypothetical protein
MLHAPAGRAQSEGSKKLNGSAASLREVETAALMPRSNQARLRTLAGGAAVQRASQMPMLQRKCACGGACPDCGQKDKFQRKAAISEPGDASELEADRVADQVMRMSEPSLQRKLKAGNVALSHGTAIAPAGMPSIVHDVVRSSGQPLDSETRAFMEPRFGYDFSQVRVHTTDRAEQSARAVNALAYTLGRDVVFGKGSYLPATSAGRRLLAHELTHVVQQSTAVAETSNPMASDANNNYEPEGESRRISHRSIDRDRAPVLRRISQSIIMRTPLFSSTLEICHALLKSRTFTVSEGGLSVTANAAWHPVPEWEGENPPDCGSDTYNVSLTREGWILDTGVADREFECGKPFTRTWGNLPKGDYHLTIWTGNTNPTCCLGGNISVSQQGASAAENKTDAKKICGPDVTKWLITRIEANAKSEAVAEMKKSNSEDWKGVDLGAVSTWADLVETGGPWDFKKDLGDAINLAPCRQNCSGKVYSVTIDGQCMTYEAPANIHFGYVGRSAGFSERVLLFGASGAQASEGRGETKDDPRDVQAIKKGFELFNAGSPNGLGKSGLEMNYYEKLPGKDGDPAGCAPCSLKL